MTEGSRSHTAPASNRAPIEEVQPVALFQGFDTFANMGRSTAVKGQARDSGATTSLFYRVCFDFVSVQQALQVSASVNASFGVSDVGGKSHFVRELGITNTTVTIVVYANHASAQTVSDVVLIGDPPADINAFYRSFGDSYVGHLVTGGEYAAVYVFYAETVDEQTKIGAALTANGISIGGGSVGGQLETSLTQVQRQISTRQTFQQFLHGYNYLPVPAPDHAIQFALNLGSLQPDAPVVISYEAVGYEHVRGMPASFSSIVATRRLYKGFGAQPGLEDQYAQLSAVRNAIHDLESVYEVYGYSDALLYRNGTTIREDIAQLAMLFQEMSTDPTKTYMAPILKGLTLGTPSLRVRIGEVGPFGGNGGDPFNQVEPGSVSKSLRLTEFSMRGGGWVDQITCTYESDSGRTKFVQGDNGGSLSPVFRLEKDERIASVSGKFWQYVVEIKLTTTANREFSWPTASAGGKEFTWAAQGTTVFLGFAGRSGKFLDQLQIVTATFDEARWVPYRVVGEVVPSEVEGAKHIPGVDVAASEVGGTKHRPHVTA